MFEVELTNLQHEERRQQCAINRQLQENGLAPKWPKTIVTIGLTLTSLITAVVVISHFVIL